MTFEEYQNTEKFPFIARQLGSYESPKMKLNSGDIFKVVGKKTIGYNDFSFIDENGSPHYYDSVEKI